MAAVQMEATIQVVHRAISAPALIFVLMVAALMASKIRHVRQATSVTGLSSVKTVDVRIGTVLQGLAVESLVLRVLNVTTAYSAEEADAFQAVRAQSSKHSITLGMKNAGGYHTALINQNSNLITYSDSYLGLLHL